MESERKTYAPMMARVVKITEETPTIKTFRLMFLRKRDRKRFSFMPGQFGMFSLMGIGEATFSMCSAPDGEEIEISVRNVGATTNAMFSMKKGDTIGVRGPYGNGFPVEEMKGRDIVIVAGGIGFPPLASVLEYILSRRESYGKVTVIYGVKEVGDIVYRYKGPAWRKHRDVKIITTVEDRCRGWDGCVGLVTDQLKKLSIDKENTVGISCGPPIMLRFVAMGFQEMGINAENIHLSLERMMQCGIGKCGHCNIGGKYVCRDGPVFPLTELRRMQEDVW